MRGRGKCDRSIQVHGPIRNTEAIPALDPQSPVDSSTPPPAGRLPQSQASLLPPANFGGPSGGAGDPSRLTLTSTCPGCAAISNPRRCRPAVFRGDSVLRGRVLPVRCRERDQQPPAALHRRRSFSRGHRSDPAGIPSGESRTPGGSPGPRGGVPYTTRSAVPRRPACVPGVHGRHCLNGGPSVGSRADRHPGRLARNSGGRKRRNGRQCPGDPLPPTVRRNDRHAVAGGLCDAGDGLHGDRRCPLDHHPGQYRERSCEPHRRADRRQPVGGAGDDSDRRHGHGGSECDRCLADTH